MRPGRLAVILVAGVCACTEPRRDVVASAPGAPAPVAPRGSEPPPAPAAEAPDGADALAPLADPEGRVHVLALEGGEEAHVAVPLGTTTPRPVVLGIHGAGDRPEWSCGEWSVVTRGRAFVVCPHGAVDPRWKGTRVWSSGRAVADAAARALSALRARYGEHVAAGPLVYGAWSQGATLAGPAIARASELGLPIEQAVLVEIGHTAVDAPATAGELRKAGVRRLVVSCSSLECRDFARRMRGAAGTVELPLHVVDVGLRGHWFDAPVFEALAAEWPWLTAEDPRWAG
jgi:hypothetical protein